MKKTFQEQLAAAANSLGLNAKSQEKKPSKKRRIKIRLKRPAASKVGVDIQPNASIGTDNNKSTPAEFCPDVMRSVGSLAAERVKLKISPVEEFCCLAELAAKFPSHCNTWRFKRLLCRAAARASLTVDIAGALLNDGEVSAFRRTFDQIRDWLPQEDFEKAQQEVVQESHQLFYALAKQKLKPFKELAERLKNIAIKCYFDLPVLNNKDLELAIEWCNGRVPQTADTEMLCADYGEHWMLGRSLSARSAEKVAAEFYLQSGLKVVDVSIQQITSRHSLSWQSHDLNVGGRPVDVKNSRRSQHSAENYTEHCVANFKVSRNQAEVAICGVFSPYLQASKFLNPSKMSSSNPIIILGETTFADQQVLKEEFEEKGLLEIDLHRVNGGAKSFIPPWMFEYPVWAYAEHDAILEQLRQVRVPHATICRIAKYNPIPASISADIELKEIWDKDSLVPWEWQFINTLTSRVRKLGLSRPVLFLTILKHFLQMTSASTGVREYGPNGYRRFIFQSDRTDVPLGIYDPLKTIDGLIGCLDKLWSAERKLIKGFKIFKLQNLNILLGKSSANDNWKTLIAYCGGRHPNNNAACGKNPLILGESKHCSVCGKLICPECDFCSRDCARK